MISDDLKALTKAKLNISRKKSGFAYVQAEFVVKSFWLVLNNSFKEVVNGSRKASTQKTSNSWYIKYIISKQAFFNHKQNL